MNIKEAKEEIIRTIKAYTAVDEDDQPVIPISSQRPLLLMGPPGIGKTAVMEQASKACGVGLLSYTITHHTRQSAIGLPFISRKNFDGKEMAVTEYTMSEIVASIYEKIQESGLREGILFIDEAYSLVEDGRTYGAEAINTIVQQMENYRDEVIVIFAGYPEKMREFLQQNEGLASRIAFHLNFPDYSADELTQILDLMLEKSAYRMTAETRNKCLEICENACQEPNFGNGRYVRNLLDHAVMRQAERLFRENRGGELSKEEACMLQAEDFEPIGMEKKESRKIGF